MQLISLISIFSLLFLQFTNGFNIHLCSSNCFCTSNSVICNRMRLNSIPKIQDKKIFYLKLPGNNIKEITTNVFNEFEDLIRIDLSFNKISNLSENAFQGPIQLKSLLLHNNQIRFLPDEIFSSHQESLEMLSLSNNRLTRLPISIEKLIKLEKIYLNGNPLYCGCEMRYFADSLRNNRIISGSIRCESPREFRNKEIKNINYDRKCKENNFESNEIPNLINSPQNTKIGLGETARFDCQVSNINSTRVEWIAPSINKEHMKLFWRNQILLVENAKEHHKGEVTCKATNDKGSISASAIMRLAENEKPYFIMKPENVTVNKGSQVVFVCNALGFPKPIIQWLKINSFTDVLETGGKYSIRKNKLIIDNVTEIDTGTKFICQASNFLGSIRESATITLKENQATENLTPCELGRKKFNETLNVARNLINTVVNETTRKLDIQSLFREPNKASRLLSRLNDEREKVIELFNEIEKTCQNSTSEFKQSLKNNFSLSPEQLTIFSQAFGCQGTANTVSCEQYKCFHKKYRSFDGKCNNFKNPNWGSSVTPFNRLLKPEYENKIFTPIGWDVERNYFGFPKPSARVVSSTLLRANKVIPNPNLSVMVMQWGQFLDHDLDFAPVDPGISSGSGGLPCNETCINSSPCFPILVPPGDRRVNRPCIGFSRSIATCGSGDASIASGFQYREQVNQITAYIDASNVYGNNPEEGRNLRNLTHNEGKLRVGMDSSTKKYLLPFNINGLVDCQKDIAMKHVECFKAGDHRSNENLGLLAMHTIWLREHNRLVDELKIINNHWDGDKLYFEARKIVGALMQKITYQDWLPIILGEKMDIIGKYHGYNESVDSSIFNSFASAAMRFGHTLINPIIYRLDENFEEIPEKHLPLHKAFFAPIKMIEDGGIDPILRGLFAKGSKTVMPENPMNSELTEKLFIMANEIALDLGSINIQRGRDHGIPSYNSFRELCGLKKAETFDDFSTEIPSAEIREKMRQVYGHPGNVDLFSGAVVEKKLPTALVGPTFSCLLATQFKRLRDGDRFYYEVPDQFTYDQLLQIKQGSLARVVCDNGDNILKAQTDIFTLPHSNSGFLNCNEIPQVDLMYWKDCSKIKFDESDEKLKAICRNKIEVKDESCLEDDDDL